LKKTNFFTEHTTDRIRYPKSQNIFASVILIHCYLFGTKYDMFLHLLQI